MKTYYNGYKIRIFPTEEQIIKINEHINACRYVWNKMIEIQNKQQEIDGRFLSEYEMNNILVKMRQEDENKWLMNVSLHSLKLTCRRLGFSYKMFFEHISGHPKFKSKKRSKQSYPLRNEARATYFVDNEYLQVPKIGRVRYSGYVDVEKGRDKAKLIDPMISYDSVSDKWLLTFRLLRESEEIKLSDYKMGIDLGERKLAVVSFGEDVFVYEDINKNKKMVAMQNKVRYLRKVVSRKYLQNNSYDKTHAINKYEHMIAKTERRMKNIRENYINHITTELVKMKPKQVVMEDLKIDEMKKNKWRAKHIQNMCWREFRVIMCKKCEKMNIRFVLANTYYPSSKICNVCKTKNTNLTNGQEIWKCEQCGSVHDRDINASINLMNYVAK